MAKIVQKITVRKRYRANNGTKTCPTCKGSGKVS